MAEAASGTLVAPDREPTSVTDLSPSQATAANGMMHTWNFEIGLPRCVELGYYREMAGVQRTLTLPFEGYGDEPKSEADVLLTAAARIQAALPPGWTVQTATEVGGLDGATNAFRRPDAQLSLIREGKTVATYAVEANVPWLRTTCSPQSINSSPWQGAKFANSARMRPMLVARYLSTQQQRVLQDRGIAYADATGNLYLMSEDPLVLLSDRGASADPWRGPGRPTTSLKGLPAARLVRALADFVPPYSVADLADLAGASLGAAYRLSDYLARRRAAHPQRTRADHGCRLARAASAVEPGRSIPRHQHDAWLP